MSITTARRLLRQAFAELRHAKKDREKIRQAAFLGWRAAREAVHAVLRSHGEQIGDMVASGQVGDFEATVLGRARGVDAQPLTDGYARAKAVLHGECFCDDMTPNGIRGELVIVGKLIDQAERDCAPRGLNSVDRKIMEGRRDYVRGDYIGPFSSASEMHDALDGTACPTCEKKTLRAVTEAVVLPIPGRPLRFEAVPHLKCTACGERLFGPESNRVMAEQRRRQRRRQRQ